MASNAFVIGAGWLTWLFFTRVLHWATPTIIGTVGMVTVAVIITSMIFEDYPFHHEKPGVARFGLLLNVAGMAFLSFYILQAIGDALVPKWTNPPLDLWIGIAGLNFITPVIVFVYFLLGRWPLPAPAPPAHDDALVIDEFEELTRRVTANESAAAARSRDAAAARSSGDRSGPGGMRRPAWPASHPAAVQASGVSDVGQPTSSDLTRGDNQRGWSYGSNAESA